jgi:hypothetical protein
LAQYAYRVKGSKKLRTSEAYFNVFVPLYGSNYQHLAVYKRYAPSSVKGGACTK